MTLTFEYDPENVQINQHAKHLRRRQFPSKKYIARSANLLADRAKLQFVHTDKHTWGLLYLDH